jgi:hypothetical protein
MRVVGMASIVATVGQAVRTRRGTGSGTTVRTSHHQVINEREGVDPAQTEAETDANCYISISKHTMPA